MDKLTEDFMRNAYNELCAIDPTTAEGGWKEDEYGEYKDMPYTLRHLTSSLLGQAFAKAFEKTIGPVKGQLQYISASEGSNA